MCARTSQDTKNKYLILSSSVKSLPGLFLENYEAVKEARKESGMVTIIYKNSVIITIDFKDGMPNDVVHHYKKQRKNLIEEFL